MKRLVSAVACFSIMTACESENMHKVKPVGCVAKGDHVFNQQLEGVILGSVATKVRISSCKGQEMSLSLLPSVTGGFTRVKSLAADTEQEVRFSAKGSGYVLREPSGAYVFLAGDISEVHTSNSH